MMVLPEGWTHDPNGVWKYRHADGRKQDEPPEGSTPEGVIALADAISTNGALETITFGDKTAVTMTTTMTEANFRGKLGGYEAQIVASFLPKCQ